MTSEQREEIRRIRLEQGLTLREIGQRFAISDGRVYEILRGDDWYRRRMRLRTKAKRKTQAERRRAESRVRSKARRAIIKGSRVADDQRSIDRLYQSAREASRIPCFYCQKPTVKGEREVDHMVPLSRGGAHAIENLCIACSKCNQSKSALTAAEFIITQRKGAPKRSKTP